MHAPTSNYISCMKAPIDRVASPTPGAITVIIGPPATGVLYFTLELQGSLRLLRVVAATAELLKISRAY
jgi:hypothetical protein